MSEVTLYNDSSARMTVMALGKAVEWNPKTTMVVSELEAEKLLKVGDYIKKYQDMANPTEALESLRKENAALKAEISELKKLNAPVEVASEIKTEKFKGK